MRKLISIASDKRIEQALRRLVCVCTCKMVRLVVHSNYADYDSLATNYDKKIVFATTTRQ